ncbi:MAG: hypothetical protein COS25_01905 [Candidatus Nealsonbacteria bacterium CG02_land_8_20_14_3_00_37_10]|uniref:Methyltransferase n=1 Tax=Candidatus Nealsonbacteria bacterium CG02_land_8_20_14_3_00_37_10 TaxID=1974699 RepID=A0A2M7D9B4_9BACT|nr:MAG: hypothetical protein COS25_01905 [Candidatus Nealsonbacteria bacterium CG02_land_8_20_14_3_00_37_10]
MEADYLKNILKPDWKLQKNRRGHSLHSMCTYMASFPPGIPKYFIEMFTQENDVVFDPFSGRGTTPAEACILGRKGIGNDLNPLAYILTRSKVRVPDRDAIKKRLVNLKNKWLTEKEKIDISKEPDKIKMIFHPYTLNQLVFLKNNLNYKNGDIDVFLIGNLMGCIHGSSKGFLSVSMPNTFSMSPNYIKKYIQEKKLILPKRDVFEVLENKINRVLEDGIPETTGECFYGDARHVKLDANSVKLIVSSPPYLKVIKYGMYNWIRLWFINEEPEMVDEKLDDTHNLPNYLIFMDEVFKEVNRIMRDDGLIVFIIGDVIKKDVSVNLAEEVWKYSGEKNGFKLLKIIEDNIEKNNKTTKIWNEKRGKATPTDRLLVMYKKRIPTLINRKVNWNKCQNKDKTLLRYQ